MATFLLGRIICEAQQLIGGISRDGGTGVPKRGGLDGGCFPVFFDGCLPFFTMKARCWTLHNLHSWCKWNLLTQRSPRYQKLQEDDHCKSAGIQMKFIDICRYVHQITICIRTLGYLDYTLSEVTGSIYNIRPPLRTNMSLTIDGWKMLEDEMSFHHNSFIGDMRSFSGGQNFRWKKFETTTWDV